MTPLRKVLMERHKKALSDETMRRNRLVAPYDVVCQLHDEFREALVLQLAATYEADRRELTWRSSWRTAVGSCEKSSNGSATWESRSMPGRYSQAVSYEQSA